MTRNKYGNIPKQVNGILFDSTKEAHRYSQLLLLKHAGLITSFKRQVSYVLREGFTDNQGKKVKPERYVADFVVTYPDGHVEIEDVKGGTATQTQVFASKWNRMKYLFKDDPTVKLVIL